MSPSEFDLRAALRDGEGSDVNVDQLILGVQADVTRRKTRLLTTAAIVGVLAIGGVGGAVLSNSGGVGSTSKSADGPQAAAGGGSYGSGGTGNGAGGAAAGSTAAPLPVGLPPQDSRRAFSASADVAACPASVADATANAAKTTDTSGPAVFTSRVSSVLLCTYGNPYVLAQDRPGPRPTSVVLRGAAASRLVASLERAPTSKPSGMCPLVRSAASALLMIGVGPDGKVAGTASTVLGTPVCNVVVFSAGRPRFDWNPPADLGSALSLATPTAGATNRIHPSPISS